VYVVFVFIRHDVLT